MSAKPSFFVELKRRNVLRAGVLYAGAVWALAQGISQLTPAIGLPDVATRWIPLAAIIGFPFWIAFAWFYEWTPQGLKRESEIAADASITRSTGRKLDKWIIAVLVIAVVLLLTNTFVWHQGAGLQAHGGNVVAAFAKVPAKSIAVLPFENLSGDPNEKYFSDGVTEEILNALAQIPDLKVSGRTSAFQFSSRDEDLRKIGVTLGVANVLEGSVQKAGDEVRINVQLVDTRTGYQLWSEKFDRKLTNIFTIEDDISNAIAGKLLVQLTGGAGQALVAQQTVDPRAHDFYLRGLALLVARGPGLRDAVAAFQSAVKIDPRYADAWGALAETETLIPRYDLDSLDAALPRARSAAQRALALDPDTASAYVALGVVQKTHLQWAEANQSFRRALALAPNDAEAVDQYAQFLFGIGQFDLALREVERAQALDPLSGVIGVVRVQILMTLRRYDEANAQMERTLKAHPDFALAYQFAALLEIYQGRFRQADVLARKGSDPYTQVLARAMLEPGKRDEVVRESETSPAYASSRSDKLTFAAYLAVLGQRERALATLDDIASHDGIMHPEWFWMPAFDPLRNDPRFKAALKKMGLPYVPSTLPAPSDVPGSTPVLH